MITSFSRDPVAMSIDMLQYNSFFTHLADLVAELETYWKPTQEFLGMREI